MKQELQDLISECSTELVDIESRIQSLQPFDKEIRYLTNYALIKAAGTAEYVYRSIVADYFSRLSDSRVDTYIDSTVRNGSMSAKYEEMCKLLGRFDTVWCNNFKNAVKSNPDSQRIVAASNSLVTNRHSFAHGKNPTATFSDIKQYYQDIVNLINIFDSIVC
ncbi:MAG: hypothetical protein J5441_07560 [Clostridia bacterium]|nr:hypothetical protein [Clostridia bacterium]